MCTGVGCSPGSPPVELSDYSGVFQSPNYPGNYFNGADCQWRVTSPVTELDAVGNSIVAV